MYEGSRSSWQKASLSREVARRDKTVDGPRTEARHPARSEVRGPEKRRRLGADRESDRGLLFAALEQKSAIVSASGFDINKSALLQAAST